MEGRTRVSLSRMILFLPLPPIPRKELFSFFSSVYLSGLCALLFVLFLTILGFRFVASVGLFFTLQKFFTSLP